MRTLISRYTGIPSNQLKFVVSPYGRPELEISMGLAHLQFNVSHSRDWYVAAFGNSLQVGIDVEYVDNDFPIIEVATRFLAPKEVALLNVSNEETRQRLFFEIWVRKEAYLKAIGKGLTLPLDSFEVPLSPTTLSTILRNGAARKGEIETGLLFSNVPVHPDYAASVVTSPPPTAVGLFDWPPSTILGTE